MPGSKSEQKYEWIDELKEKGTAKKKYYQSVRLMGNQVKDFKEDDYLVSVNDTVYMMNDDDLDRPFIARVVSLCKIDNNNGSMSCQWFYRPKEIPNYRKKSLVGIGDKPLKSTKIKFDDSELILSNHIDSNDLRCILSKCHVIYGDIARIRDQVEKTGEYNGSDWMKAFMVDNNEQKEEDNDDDDEEEELEIYMCNLKFEIQKSPPLLSLLDVRDVHKNEPNLVVPMIVEHKENQLSITNLIHQEEIGEKEVNLQSERTSASFDDGLTEDDDDATVIQTPILRHFSLPPQELSDDIPSLPTEVKDDQQDNEIVVKKAFDALTKIFKIDDIENSPRQSNISSKVLTDWRQVLHEFKAKENDLNTPTSEPKVPSPTLLPHSDITESPTFLGKTQNLPIRSVPRYARIAPFVRKDFDHFTPYTPIVKNFLDPTITSPGFGRVIKSSPYASSVRGAFSPVPTRPIASRDSFVSIDEQELKSMEYLRVHRAETLRYMLKCGYLSVPNFCTLSSVSENSFHHLYRFVTSSLDICDLNGNFEQCACAMSSALDGPK